MGNPISDQVMVAGANLELRDVVIFGGGLAGIAAAIQLLDRGIKPTLVERRPFLGGRAFSFADQSSGEEIDNGQHVILGVCYQFLELLKRLGTHQDLELGPTLEVPVSLDSRISMLRADRIFGNAAALLGYRHLSVMDRLAVARVLAGMKFARYGCCEEEDQKSITFAKWLSAYGQSDETIKRFWSMFILPVFNCRIDEVAAYDAIGFTRAALLGRASDAAVGYPKKGLSSLIGHPAFEYLSTNGAEVISRASVDSFAPLDESSFEVQLSNGQNLRADAVISALTPNVLKGILPKSDARCARLASKLAEFRYSPIVAVHLWYERPVMNERVKAFLDLDLQWVFNDSALRNTSRPGRQHIVISLSAADEWLSLSKQQVLDRIKPAMNAAFPRVRTTRLLNSSVLKTLEATIKIEPGSQKLRLATVTDIPGLFLAGDWIDTGLPATMEGAVQSGNAAAMQVTDWLRNSSARLGHSDDRVS